MAPFWYPPWDRRAPARLSSQASKPRVHTRGYPDAALRAQAPLGAPSACSAPRGEHDATGPAAHNWEHLTAEQYRHRIADLVRTIEQDAEQKVRNGGREPLGADAMMAENPRNAPAKPKRSPAPAFQHATRAARQELRDAYAEFMTEYREASAKLRAGDRMAIFPVGSFPPALPFVQ